MDENIESEFGDQMPDFSNRYFTEDIPYGMRFIVDTAHRHGQPIPVTQMVYDWGMSHLVKEEE